MDALRRAGALSVSLVAEQAGQVVGHVAFSPVAVSDRAGGWYGLGPLSVLPARQRLGIGQALVRAGLDRLRGAGANGCVLVGESAYYARFGFAHDPALSYPGIPQEYFLALPFSPGRARGEVSYHPAFSVAPP